MMWQQVIIWQKMGICSHFLHWFPQHYTALHSNNILHHQGNWWLGNCTPVVKETRHILSDQWSHAINGYLSPFLHRSQQRASENMCLTIRANEGSKLGPDQSIERLWRYWMISVYWVGVWKVMWLASHVCECGVFNRMWVHVGPKLRATINNS